MKNTLTGILEMMAKIDNSYPNKSILEENVFYEDEKDLTPKDASDGTETDDGGDNVTPAEQVGVQPEDDSDNSHEAEDLNTFEKVNVNPNAQTITRYGSDDDTVVKNRREFPFEKDSFGKPIFNGKAKYNPEILNTNDNDDTVNTGHIGYEKEPYWSQAFDMSSDTIHNLQEIEDTISQIPGLVIKDDRILNGTLIQLRGEEEGVLSQPKNRQNISFINGFGASGVRGKNEEDFLGFEFGKIVGIPYAESPKEVIAKVCDICGINKIPGNMAKLIESIKRLPDFNEKKYELDPNNLDFSLSNSPSQKEQIMRLVSKNGAQEKMDSYRSENAGKISNLKAYWIINGGLGKLKQDYKFDSVVGLLQNIPFKKLRSVSYVASKIIRTNNTKAENINFVRNYISKYGGVKSYIFNYKVPKNAELDGKTVKIMPSIDDPVTDMDVESLIGNASYIINNAIDHDEEIHKNGFVRGKKYDSLRAFIVKNGDDDPFVKYEGEDGKITYFSPEGYGGGNMYSVFDYVYETFMAITHATTEKSSKDSDGTLLYKQGLASFYETVGDIMKSGFGDILTAIPLTDIMDDQIDAVDYLQKIATDDREKFGIVSDYLNAVKKNNFKLITYAKDENGNIQVSGEKMTLETFFAKSLGASVYATQDTLAQSIREKSLKAKGVEFGEELNRPSLKYDRKADPHLQKIIGPKSIDIYLKREAEVDGVSKLAIEYQGEQHYVPHCTLGIREAELNANTGKFPIDKTHARKPGMTTDIQLFQTIPNFSDRMEALIKLALSNSSDSTQHSSEQGLKQKVWNYLSTYKKDVDDSADTDQGPTGDWTKWNTVSDIDSRRRWYSEFLVYLQQMADKQKFLALKSDGWRCLYVCPSGNRITWDDVLQAGSVKHASAFTLSGKKIGRVFDVGQQGAMTSNGQTFQQVAADTAKIQESIIQEEAVRDEYNPAYFTYRYSESRNLNNMPLLFDPSSNLAMEIDDFINNRK